MAADIVPVLSQGMQQMLDETQADSANMRRMYVALGDRIADAIPLLQTGSWAAAC